MNETTKKPLMRALVLISDVKIAKKAVELFKASHMPIHFQLRGQGTASNELIDVMGLGSTAKSILIGIMPKLFAESFLCKMEKELNLGMVNTGIAFTTIINGMSTSAVKWLDENTRKDWSYSMEQDTKQTTSRSVESLITAIIDRGYSEDVMEAARKAGAGGGTVLRARQVGDEAALHFFDVSIQEEKEMVIILASNENKVAIMEAVSKQCGIHSEAHGIVISTPIDKVVGLA